MIYKLSFQDKAKFEQLKKDVLIESSEQEENEQLKKGIAIIFEGNVPFDAKYDEEGNEISPSGVHDDYAVNIVTDKEIDELDEFILYPFPKTWHNRVGGEKESDIVTPKNIQQ